MAGVLAAVQAGLVPASLRALQSGPRFRARQGSQPRSRAVENRALPLIMTWCPDKRAVNTCQARVPAPTAQQKPLQNFGPPRKNLGEYRTLPALRRPPP